ncbi:DUF488 domain-containing protein [Yinghuangia seranimata]|uniref:DUF488 domain-containing protein n=1 Tax=Yinghuangia seranimata TaxID=408067 RepID=UPI00248B3350|nr:DUF488 family protein [Yinghuangia seranimata]MDI2125978.1 DUF488 family protein [Yinghuangia seranimata]
MAKRSADLPVFRLRRVQDPPEAADGCRVLVDRLWPRGVSKERAALDAWAKEVAPSTELRKWFHAQGEGVFPEFAARYAAELEGDEQQAGIADLRARALDGPVTLLTAVKDPAGSYLSVLLEELTGDA